MSKHTPGPWHWRNGRLEAVTPAWEARIATILDDEGCMVFRETYGQGVDAKTEQEANLRLIATAPDLLQALKALVEEMARRGTSDPGNGYSDLVMQAEAAIAQAEGGVA